MFVYSVWAKVGFYNMNLDIGCSKELVLFSCTVYGQRLVSTI